MTAELMHDFHISAKDIGLLGGVFCIAYAVLQMPSGWLIDKYGARIMLTALSLTAAFATFVFSMTSYFYIALLTRIIAGIGVSAGFIATYYLAARWLPHHYFSIVAGFLHLAASMGAILAQAPLASLVNHAGWRVALFDSGIAGICLAVMYVLFIRNGPPKTEKENKTYRGFFHSIVHCFSVQQLRWVSVCSFLGWLPMSVLGALWGVPYLMAAYHWNNVQASNACSLFWCGSAVGAIFLSWLSEKMVRRKRPLIICFFGEIVGSIVIIFAPNLPFVLVYLALFVLGLCICMQTLSFTLIKENVCFSYFACASGMNNAAAIISSAMGQYLFGYMLDAQTHNSTIYSVLNYQKALIILPVVALMGLVVCYTKIKETHCQIQVF